MEVKRELFSKSMKMLLTYVSILALLNSPSIIVQAEEEPAISSEAAILIDSTTSEVLFEKTPIVRCILQV